MNSVLISTRPKWCEKICHKIGKDENGKPIYEKRIEVRKTAPKEVPFKAYIYCTKAKSQWRYSDYEGAYENSKGEIVYAQQHIIGEFICDKVYNLVNAFGGIVFADENLNQLEPQLFSDMSCLTDEQIADYLGNKDGYGWHISDLKIYDRPKELSEFISSKPKNKFRAHGDNLTRPPQSWLYVEELK